jgi:hypothetical protein
VAANSIFTSLSLADISNISVLSLPIYPIDVTNSGWYPFGAADTSSDGVASQGFSPHTVHEMGGNSGGLFDPYEMRGALADNLDVIPSEELSAGNRRLRGGRGGSTKYTPPPRYSPQRKLNKRNDTQALDMNGAVVGVNAFEEEI